MVGARHHRVVVFDNIIDCQHSWPKPIGLKNFRNIKIGGDQRLSRCRNRKKASKAKQYNSKHFPLLRMLLFIGSATNCGSAEAMSALGRKQPFTVILAQWLLSGAKRTLVSDLCQ